MSHRALDLALKEVENEEDEVENGSANETVNCTEEEDHQNENENV